MPAGLDPAQSVGRLVADRPGRARVLERFGVDYCCGGSRTLAEACLPCGARVAEVLAALQDADAAAAARGEAEPDFRAWPLARVVQHVLDVHHAFLCEELPALAALADKVARVHGARHPDLLRLAEAFAVFRVELDEHMLKEEEVFFPAVLEWEQTGRLPAFFGGSLRVPVFVMEGDHRAADRAMRFFRQLTNGYRAPDDACNSWRALTARLQALEEDVHRHVHLETEFIQARALELAGPPRR